MIDITHKGISSRQAIAGGWLECQPDILTKVHNDQLPKGNLFDIARAAALLAAKQTPALIPHCHPVSIDGTLVEFFYYLDGSYYLIDTKGRRQTLKQAPQLPQAILESADNPAHITTAWIYCRIAVDSVARTGPEMEALLSCSVALLTIYDLLKPLDKNLIIREQRLLQKLGGKSDPRLRIKEGTTVAILYQEKSPGQLPDAVQVARDIISEQGVPIETVQALQLDPEKTRQQITQLGAAIILTIGGTTPRNGSPVTKLIQLIAPDAIPGLSESMRRHGGDRNPVALYSRTYAASLDQQLILCLPGSQEGVRQSLQAIIPAIWQGPRMLGPNRKENQVSRDDQTESHN